jgi:lipid-A-disaccharide synthase
LPNVLAGEFVVPELLQDDATPENLAQALLNLLEDSLVRRRIEARFSRMRAGLRRNAADTAAEVVVRLLGAAA